MAKKYLWFLQKIHILLIGFFWVLPGISIAQVVISNIAEYQLGNLPDTKPANLTTFYNQIQLEYYHDNLTIGLRYESFRASKLDRKYNKFSQRYLEWQNGWLRIRAGNFYSILGRGIVFRAFELPGVVQEDARNRVRFGLTRDVDGFIAEVNKDFLEITVLRGESFDSTLPLSYEQKSRSLGIVEGGQVKIRPKNGIMVGGTYARYSLANLERFEVGSGILGLSVSSLMRDRLPDDFVLDFYVEHAQKQGKLDQVFSTKANPAYAFYFSGNLIYNNFGLSVEHKDYHDFGLTMNEPPTLTREHSFYLLNRATHVLHPEDEKGWQFEATYSLVNQMTIIANYSKAENRTLLTRKFEVEESFIEADIYVTNDILTRIFLDKSKDENPEKSFADRKTAGVNFDWQFSDYNSINLDLQGQETLKTFEFAPNRNKFNDIFFSIGFARSPSFSVSIVRQKTNDPLDTVDPAKYNNLWSINVNYQISDEHELFLFYGKRRGGLACTSGTCYEVLAFDGFELRFISRL